MSDLFAWQCLLTILSCVVCYLLGKRKVSNDVERERAEALANANKARETLRDYSAVEQLHERFKR